MRWVISSAERVVWESRIWKFVDIVSEYANYKLWCLGTIRLLIIGCYNRTMLNRRTKHKQIGFYIITHGFMFIGVRESPKNEQWQINIKP